MTHRCLRLTTEIQRVDISLPFEREEVYCVPCKMVGYSGPSHFLPTYIEVYAGGIIHTRSETLPKEIRLAE